ncbi:mannitol dehydrogenase family protein [Sphingomonas corticis]|jgi:fructuronate reductase|nr:mannitol dehydrogenase family protein [Sphingomonas corticis]
MIGERNAREGDGRMEMADTQGMRLSRATLDRLPDMVARPAYPLAERPPGIVHFGPGAFHRAHQAAYVDAILPRDPRWSIAAVALHSTSVADALAPQDGLYVLAEIASPPRHRVIGALGELLTAKRDGAAILARLAAPTTLLVTVTVTEKGYCLDPNGALDREHPGIVQDLAQPERPTTLIGWLVAGLSARRDADVGGLTILSCDNLPGNGRLLGGAVRDFARLRDPALADWIEREVRFPSSMVDSITPATDDRLRAAVREATGVIDAWPIQREPFAQWVVEDEFAGERPPLGIAGVQFVQDVAPFEEAKLRLLNGAHSTLAYLGILLGHETVADAMADAPLAALVERLMRADIAPTLHPLEGQSLDDYVTAILARFRNPAMRHLLAQIAWDGSQKLPIRLLGTMADRLAARADVARLAWPVAAWMRFLRRSRAADDPLVDPLRDRLLPLARGDDPLALLGVEQVFPPALAADPRFREAVARAYDRLADPRAAVDEEGRS